MDLTIYEPENRIAAAGELQALGALANQAAAAGAFERYQAGKAANTNRRHKADLALFADFIRGKGVQPGDLYEQPAAWRGITAGLVEAFTLWMLNRAYSIASVNQRLSAVKVYAKLATKASEMDPGELVKIRAIAGYKLSEGRRIDEKRHAVGIPTRRGGKKAEPVSITRQQARALKSQPDSPQGRRDSLLMCLLLDHGLRCGEVAGLRVTDFDLTAGELRFYRPKVDKVQTHRLTPDTRRAARAYFGRDAAAAGPLLRGSRKDGSLADSGMSEQSITERVRVLGVRAGLEGLSAHDCRHFWATQAAANKTPVDRLQDAGGWSSPAMPLRYVEAAKIANEGVNLGSD